MTPRPTIVLFDIDGTLVSTGGLARKALQTAVEEHFGDAATFAFSFGGMTDRAIFRRGLEAMGEKYNDDRARPVLDRYLTLLRDHLDAANGMHRTYRGAVDVVRRTAAEADVAAGIGTGNVEAGARLKLRPFGLNELLPFGGFGSDAEPRAEVIAHGARRGAERLGAALNDCRLVIVGDTPADVRAAHDNGGICVGVTTGTASAEQLHEAGAEHVFPGLDAEGVLDAILGAGR